MIKIKIDNREVEVARGTSVLEAAKSIGIHIPTLCYLKGYGNNPSCMVCLIKDKKTGNLQPACALPVAENMDIISEDEEVKNARKEALELLLSSHVGDCEAPCRVACPAFMNIPVMNRLIMAGKFADALKIVKEEIALPLILGHVCSAPCEKVCRRTQIDEAVSICQLKKFVAVADINSDNPYMPSKAQATHKKVAIIGAGPAGLAAAFHLTKMGHHCRVFDKNQKAGGSLLKTSEEELPKAVLQSETDFLKAFGIEFKLETTIDNELLKNKLKKEYDAVIIAGGIAKSSEINNFDIENMEPGIFACGSVVRLQKMAVKALAQGKAAAFSVNKYLINNTAEKQHMQFDSRFGKLMPAEYEEYLKESVKDKQVKPQNGILNGYAPEEAIREANRCMHCDCRKPDTCKLRIYADEYGADRKKYLFGERKLIRKYFNHEYLVYEPEKCIKCSLCIEIAAENNEETGLTNMGRGFGVRVGIPFNKTMKEALTHSAKKCVQACPTGALSAKEGEL